jgi:hypothetical protein
LDDIVYRAEWISRGLPDTSASASAAPPPPPNFSRLFHLCPTIHALENIEKSRVKISTFKDANDPFELSIFFSRRPDEQARLNKFIDDVAGRLGVVCFSEDWLDPVYWSHYADRHRGVALGFDVSDANALIVKYQKHRIEFPNRAPAKSDVDIFLGTKFESWRYERERRIMAGLSAADFDDGIWFERFGPEMILKEVILGPLCSEDVTTVRACVDAIHTGVRTYKARLAKKFFSIVPDEPTVPPKT